MKISSDWNVGRLLGATSLAGAALVASGCLAVSQAGSRGGVEAGQTSQQELRQRLDRLESRIENQGLMEMAQTVERLQNEVRQLRGEIEQQAHELEGLRKRQRDLYLDIDRRLSDLQLQGSAVAGVQGGLPDAGGEEGDGGSPEPAGGADAEQERADYKSAFETLREGRYDDAIKAFNAFLEQYPDGGYADNAQYWLGEAHYVSQQFEQAATEFKKVIEQFPQSTKVPDARLKLGYTHYELQQWDKAREVLNGILDAHPNTSVAPLAEKRLLRMSEEGH
jgi:tol-pal system protein YbgF